MTIWTQFQDYVSTLCIFYEASVVRTTGNRVYGHSYKRTPAVEIQRYASNASYTVNFLHSLRGIDHYNILQGASNGLELLTFFEEAVTIYDINGLPIFLPDDTVVMGNCGFHHPKDIEPLLRQCLHLNGINLIFQPPYCPHLNTSEFVFRQMKAGMRKDPQYSYDFTELAIMDSLDNITNVHSHKYFQICGYII